MPNTRSEQASALAAELRTLIGQLRRLARERVGTGGLNASQAAALLRLERDGPATVSHLARAEGVRPQSMRAVIISLKEAGFVKGAPDPNDGRQTILVLTDKWHSWIAQGRAARQDWLSRIVQERLSLTEQQQVSEALDLLKRLVDDYHPTQPTKNPSRSIP